MNFSSILFVVISCLASLAYSNQNQSCQTYSVSCACFSAVPFEGFKLHIVEKCDAQETWHTTYDAPAFETEAQCEAATKTDPTCLSIAK